MAGGSSEYRLTFTVAANDENVARVMKAVQKALKDTGKEGKNSAKTASQQWKQAGSQISAGMKKLRGSVSLLKGAFVALVGAAGLGKVAKAALSFEKDMASIATIVDDLDGQMGTLETRVRSTAVEFAQPVSTVAKAQYDIISAGFQDASESAEVLRISSQLATAGIAEVGPTADLLTTVLNGFQLQAEDAGHAADILQLTIKRGKTTMNEMSATFGRLAPTANMAGISLEEVAATFSVLTANGLKSAEASTALNRLMAAMAAPTDQAAQAFEEAGIQLFELDATGKQVVRPLAEVLAQFEGMDAATIAEFFPNIRAVKALGSATANMETLNGTFAEFQDEARTGGVMMEAFGRASNTNEFKVRQMKAAVGDLAIEMGQGFTGELGAGSDEFVENLERMKVSAREFGEWIGQAMKATAKFIKEHKTGLLVLIGLWAAMKVAIFAATAAEAFAMIWSGIMSAVAATKTWIATMGAARIAALALQAAMGLAVIAVAALIAKPLSSWLANAVYGTDELLAKLERLDQAGEKAMSLSDAAFQRTTGMSAAAAGELASNGEAIVTRQTKIYDAVAGVYLEAGTDIRKYVEAAKAAGRETSLTHVTMAAQVINTQDSIKTALETAIASHEAYAESLVASGEAADMTSAREMAEEQLNLAAAVDETAFAQDRWFESMEASEQEEFYTGLLDALGMQAYQFAELDAITQAGLAQQFNLYNDQIFQQETLTAKLLEAQRVHNSMVAVHGAGSQAALNQAAAVDLISNKLITVNSNIAETTTRWEGMMRAAGVANASVVSGINAETEAQVESNRRRASSGGSRRSSEKKAAERHAKSLAKIRAKEEEQYEKGQKRATAVFIEELNKRLEAAEASGSATLTRQIAVNVEREAWDEFEDSVDDALGEFEDDIGGVADGFDRFSEIQAGTGSNTVQQFDFITSSIQRMDAQVMASKATMSDFATVTIGDLTNLHEAAVGKLADTLGVTPEAANNVSLLVQEAAQRGVSSIDWLVASTGARPADIRARYGEIITLTEEFVDRQAEAQNKVQKKIDETNETAVDSYVSMAEAAIDMEGITTAQLREVIAALKETNDPLAEVAVRFVEAKIRSMELSAELDRLEKKFDLGAARAESTSFAILGVGAAISNLVLEGKDGTVTLGNFGDALSTIGDRSVSTGDKLTALTKAFVPTRVVDTLRSIRDWNTNVWSSILYSINSTETSIVDVFKTIGKQSMNVWNSLIGPSASGVLAKLGEDGVKAGQRIKNALNEAFGPSAFKGYLDSLSDLGSKLSSLSPEDAGEARDSITSGLADLGANAENMGFFQLIKGMQDAKDLAGEFEGMGEEGLSGAAGAAAQKMGDEIKKRVGKSLLAAVGAAAKAFASMTKAVLGGIVSLASTALTQVMSPEALETALTGMTDFASNLSGIGERMGDLISGLVDAIPKVVSEIANEMPKIVQSLAEGLPKLVTAIAEAIPTILTALVENIGPLVDAIVEAILGLIDYLVENAEVIVGQLVEALSTIVIGIGDILGGIIEAVGTIIPTLIDGIISLIATALPNLLNSIFESLPTLITGVLDGVVSLIQGIVLLLMETVPQIITDLLTALPGIITSLISGIVGIIGSLVTDFIPNLPDIVLGILEAILLSIDDIIFALVEGLVGAVPDIIMAVAEMLPVLVVELITMLIVELPALVLALVAELLIALPRIIWEIVLAVGKAFVGLFAGLFKGFSALGESLSSMAERVSGYWDAVSETAREWAGKLREQTKKFGEWVTKHATGLWNWLRGWTSALWRWISDLGVAMWEWIAAIPQGLWDWLVGLWDAFTEFLGKLASTLSGGLSTAGEDKEDRKGLGKVVGAVGDGIKAAWNWATGKRFGGMVSARRGLSQAMAGMGGDYTDIFGDDAIPIMAHAGEAVLNRNAVRSIGGGPGVFQMNQGVTPDPMGRFLQDSTSFSSATPGGDTIVQFQGGAVFAKQAGSVVDDLTNTNFRRGRGRVRKFLNVRYGSTPGLKGNK